jgi:hypothetical protein
MFTVRPGLAVEKPEAMVPEQVTIDPAEVQSASAVVLHAPIPAAGKMVASARQTIRCLSAWRDCMISPL